MRRTLKTLSPCLVAFLLMLTIASAGNAQELQKKLEGLKGISGIEKLESDHYAEKYLVRITQPVDHKNPAAGTFTQRVIVAHVGFDRPTILVTEGYGAAYALNPRYQEELSKLLDANMVFVEYRYFLESTPTPCNWKYLTAENSAYDLHNVNQIFRELYTGKWVSTGISKGGQTTCLYRAWFPDDVDFSVPYVAPLNRGVEDGRHEPFLRKVGTKKDRQKIEGYLLKNEMTNQVKILKEAKGETQGRNRPDAGKVLQGQETGIPHSDSRSIGLLRPGIPVRPLAMGYADQRDPAAHIRCKDTVLSFG